MGLFKKIFTKHNSEHLLEWQNAIIVDSPNKLITNETQLKEITRTQIQIDIKQIQDCSKILQNTKSAEIFFSRLNLMEKRTLHGAKLEQFYKCTNISFAECLQQFYQDRDELIMEFLKRYYFALLDKTDELKTMKGKINQCKKFKEELLPYYSYMTEEHIQYIEPKINLYQE